MRLFHVSEKEDIEVFVPRKPAREDVDPTPVVWALAETHLPNFLTPRNCPRIAYQAGPDTTEADRACFLSSGARHVVAIEQAWFRAMLETTLYVYEFDSEHFKLQDAAAGYYVSRETEMPVGKVCLTDLPGALFARDTELRILPNLWAFADAVQRSTLQWSICRMAFAQPRPEF